MQRVPSFLFAALLAGCGGSATQVGSSDAGHPDQRTGEPAEAGAPHEAAPPDARGAREAAAKPSITFVDTATGATVTKVVIGEPLDFVVRGAPPGAKVTLRACMNGLGVWASSADFVASEGGEVDVATSAPTAGTYSGADADGLLWSMTEQKGACDPAVPRYSMGIEATVAGEPLADANLAWYLWASDVTCAPVSDDGLVGYYCARKGAPPVGGIVTFGGSEGGLGTGEANAGYYASLGYPSLGLAYFGAGSLPTTLKNIPLEYFQKAFSWLAKQKEVKPGKLLVNGLSRGGELALLLGATFPEVTSVVAELPSGVLWGSTDISDSPAWMYKGKPLPYITAIGSGVAYAVKEPGGITAYADVPYFTSALAASTPAQIAAATTQVQNTKGPVLMIAGFDDQLWGACDLAQYAVDQLVSSGHADKYGDSLLCYPQAGHNVDSFGLDGPTTDAMYWRDMGTTIAMGGTPAGIAHASRDADTMKRAFFVANLE